MAIALRGSLGTAATGTTSASPTFAQATASGNLLICWAISTAGGLGTPSGWSTSGGDAFADVYYKANSGDTETAPVITGTSGFIEAQLAEFTGVPATSPLDRVSSIGSSLTSPQALSTAGTDATSGELVIGVSSYVFSMAATKTTTHAYNNGATALNNANNDGTSSANHYRFSYGITTGNASADQLTDTFTITNITGHEMVVFSFKVAPAQILPTLVTPRARPN